MSLAITTTPAGNALRRIAAMPAALALLSSVLLLGACASVPMPVEQMAVAEAAVQHATTTGTNATNAAEVQAASAKLARARQAMADKQPLLARRLAEQVEVEARLQALDTKKAERGLVVTLGDVPLDNGQSRLLADGSRNMVRLAEVFKRNPARSASIEGYTDNVSSASANMSLAGRRADAVVAALIGLGVSADRLCSVAHGEDMPAARNHSPACRQMNRRVEVVFAPQGDEPSPRALWGRRAPSPHHPLLQRLNRSERFSMPHPDHHQLRAVRQSPALSIGALALLRADHRAMRHLFNALRRARSDGEQQALVADICALLSMHVQIRAEIFDSALKVASLGASCLAGPGAARDDIWGLIAQLEQGAPAGA